MKHIGCKQLFTGSYNAFRCQWGHVIRCPFLTMPTHSLLHAQGTLKISSPYLETVKRYKHLNIIGSISKAIPKTTWQRSYRKSHLGRSERVKGIRAHDLCDTRAMKPLSQLEQVSLLGSLCCHERTQCIIEMNAYTWKCGLKPKERGYPHLFGHFEKLTLAET